jgi:hypothetical protein
VFTVTCWSLQHEEALLCLLWNRSSWNHDKRVLHSGADMPTLASMTDVHCSVWQAILLGGVEDAGKNEEGALSSIDVPRVAAWHRYLPFFGLAAHLLTAPMAAASGSTAVSSDSREA